MGKRRIKAESEAFKQSGASKDDIRLNSYSLKTGTSYGERDTVCEIGFILDGQRITVILHKDDNGSWYVCEECTHFK